MTTDLIGLTVERAAEALNAAGREFKVIENCDSLDDADCVLVTAVRESGGETTLVTSRFKRSID